MSSTSLWVVSIADGYGATATGQDGLRVAADSAEAAIDKIRERPDSKSKCVIELKWDGWVEL